MSKVIPMNPKSPAHKTIRTTLYDLVAAINEEAPKGAEHLAAEIVGHYLKKGKIRFLEGTPDFAAFG